MHAGSVLRLPRQVIDVRGPDAATLLDSLLTQRIPAPDPASGPRYAALLTPQGKIVTDMILWPREDGYRIDVAEERAAALAARLKLYKLRAAVEIAPAADWAVVAGAGVADPRHRDFGLRGLAPAVEAPGFDPAAFAAHEARRIAAGLPDPARDAAAEEVFALEALLEELNGVDFHKGCFVGQENVSRMKRRATTRRKFCRLAFDGPPPPFGAPVTAGAAALGEVRSTTNGAAIALLRLDRALATTESLMADGRSVRLDPPEWLILPEGDKDAGDKEGG